jgi:hypothetical protein
MIHGSVLDGVLTTVGEFEVHRQGPLWFLKQIQLLWRTMKKEEESLEKETQHRDQTMARPGADRTSLIYRTHLTTVY